MLRKPRPRGLTRAGAWDTATPARDARSQQRIRNGHPEPYAVPVWCLGTRWTAWQIGQKTLSSTDGWQQRREGDELVDPTIELVACGSSGVHADVRHLEASVLQECYDVVDYISLHAYYEQGTTTRQLPLVRADMDAFIAASLHVRHVRACDSQRRRITFFMMEVWYLSAARRVTRREWAAPVDRDVYTLADAVVVAHY